MKPYIIYAILSLFAAGILNFLYKIIAHKNYDTKLVNIYSYLTSFVMAFFYFFIISDFNFNKIDFLFIAFLAFVNVTLFIFSIFSRVESLKNIDSVLFFPLYKTFGPILVTLISLFFFNETLNTKEITGIIIGIIVPLLLITKKENMIQKNLFIGVIFVILTAIITSISSITNKEIMVKNLDFHLFLVFLTFFGFLFSLILYFFSKNKQNFETKKDKKDLIKFSIIQGFIYFISVYFFTRAMGGNFAVAYTINSFSILIPIILSIIFFKEHFSLKKAFVIALSIISIILFI